MTTNSDLSGVTRRLVTLTPQDPRFHRYLDGSFSRTHRALALESLNINTLGEEVTFAVVEKSTLQAPGFFALCFRLIRPSRWIFTAAPLALTLALLVKHSGPFAHDGTFVPVALTTLLGVSLLHLSIQWLAEFSDHMTGRDRAPSLLQVEPNPIQAGFVTARFVRRLSFATMGLAIACGLPVVIVQGWRVAFMAVLGLLLGLGFSLQSSGWKSRGFGEVIVFLLSGPLLTDSFAWALDGEWNAMVAGFGVMTGLIGLLVYHMTQMVRMMADSQVGVRSWAVRLGFDHSKRLALAILLLVPFVLLLNCLYIGDWTLFVASFVAMLLPTWSAFQHVRRIESPLASSLRESTFIVRRWAWLWVIILCVLLVL